MKRILFYIKNYRGLIGLAIVANVLMSIFQVASIPFLQLFLKILFDDKNAPTDAAASVEKNSRLAAFEQWAAQRLADLQAHHGREKALVIVCGIIVLLFFGKNLFRYLSLYWISPVRFGVVRDLRRRLMEKIMSLPLGYFSEARKGDLLSRATSDIMEFEWSILNVIEAIAREPIAIAGSLAFMFFISPNLTLVVFALMVFAGAAIGGLGSRLRRQSSEAQSRLGALVSTIEETVSGLRIIKGFRAERAQMARFERQNAAQSQLLIDIHRRRDLAAPMSEFLGIAVFVVLLIYGSRQVFAGALMPETFLAFLYAFFSVIDPAKNLSTASYNIRKGLAALDRVDEVLSAENTILEKPDAFEIASFESRIEFRNVSFSYKTTSREALRPALSNIDLSIEKGKIVALVGASGAGKSTMADLLPRFYDPSEGAILIDGHDLRDLTLDSLRSLMGIVTQEAVLFNDSVLENIRFGAPSATMEQIVEAARAANALEFIEKMPEKFDSNIGDRGQKLSGGQRQRLTIARALLKNPPILILDEATSALDSESEKLVQEALSKLMAGRTSLVIAHRLSTIQSADEIVVLDGGQIVERGSHRALMQKDGAYRRLVELQGL